MRDKIDEKLQELAKEYIGDVMCDSWLNKVKSLIAEEVEGIIEEGKPMTETMINFGEQSATATKYIAGLHKGFNVGLEQYEKNMRKLAKEKGVGR